jgi:parallel beta-helix repeat protein
LALKLIQQTQEETKMFMNRALPRLARAGVRVTVLLSLLVCLVAVVPVYAQGNRYVDKNATRQCGGNTPCYTSIQAGVDAAKSGDTIYVYPGKYDESVNLSAADAHRDLTLIAVNAAGVPTPGTVTVEYSGIEAELFTSPALDGDLTIDGFILHSAFPGIEVEVDGGPGANRDVVISNVAATETDDDGIAVSADGNVTISGCTASDNDEHGVYVVSEGDVLLSDCTANGNGLSGIWVRSLGHVAITNCTAEGNGVAGFDVDDPGSLAIMACIARDNEGSGVALESYPTALEVGGSIICGNGEAGLELVSVVDVDAEGNWWGCGGGPGAAGCDTIDQGPGTVDFRPWISSISSSGTPDPATIGQPTVVSFRFHGGSPALYLGQGPGDLRGPAPFTVHTDNGTLNGSGATVEECINAANGTLKVTLVPEREGTATVTVLGPCGLSDLDGATVVLQVSAVEFVPEPGSVMLLASGLMGLAGYAGLRVRKR